MAPAACSPAASAQFPSTALARATDAIEFDVRVPPSGVVAIAGIQQLWIGKNHAGKIATLWMDLTSVHVIVDEAVVKTVLSRLTTTDLERLQMRGARPGRCAPAVVAGPR
ncbi:hypothetical protein ACWDTG_25880 [Rhodococcus zopfii]